MIETLCIDSADMPEEINRSEWISKGMKYHITHVWFHSMQGIQGCSLKEVKLTEKSYPYATYKLSRFAVTPEGLLELIQMMKDCSELNEVDIKKLLRQSRLNIV